MDVRLDGRTAVVTGGSRGLGLATATAMAGSGAKVAIFARDEEQLQVAGREIKNATGSSPLAVPCDVTVPSSIEAAFTQVRDTLGPVDVLVNGAGRTHHSRFESITDEGWQADLELKLFGAIRCTRQVWDGMVQRRWGRIVNVVNIGGKAPKAAGAPTHVSRAAGIAFTKVLSHEGAPHNVLVNALCVGLIVSNQFVKRHQDTAPEMSFDDYVESVGRTIPLGRMGQPAEFANIACFLASDAASYVTGTAINVDGGLSPVV